METIWTCVDELICTAKRCYFLADNSDSPDEYDVSEQIIDRFDIIDVTEVLKRKKINFEDAEEREFFRTATLVSKNPGKIRELVEPWLGSGAEFVAQKVPRRTIASGGINDQNIEAAINSYEAGIKN